MDETRRLAAIMFTDIVGSTTMMHHDENAAVQAVSKHKKAVEHCVQTHRGEVVNFYGDGSLSIFSSATAVLKCAMELQAAMNESPKVPLRIGIHIGEILIKDGEVFGDGVNIASRIESLGQPGTVMFSEEVYFKIRNNKEFSAELIGPFEFKNVDEPMNVYALANKGFPVPPKNSITGKLKGDSQQGEAVTVFWKVLNIFSRKKLSPAAELNANSIAVLPFQQSGNASDNSFIADGISDEIRSRLLNIKDLKVISRSSCMAYKDKAVPLKKLAKDLGVNYVLEGRVQHHNSGSMIMAELNYAPADKLIWSLPTVKLSLEAPFEIQSKIARQVADELKLQLSAEEKSKLEAVPTHNPEAFLSFQRGQELLHRGFGFIPELEEAEKQFLKAIELDSTFTKAYIGLCDTYLDYIFWGRAAAKNMIGKALKYCLKALELDPKSGEAWGGLGAINFYSLQLRESKEYLEKALKLSPGYVEGYVKLGWIHSVNKNTEQAMNYFRIAVDLDPLSTKYVGDMAQVCYNECNYDRGIEIAEEALKKFPGDSWLLWILGTLYFGKGDYIKSRDTLLRRPTGKMNWFLGHVYGVMGETENAKAILDYLLKKNEEQFVPSLMIATVYVGLGDYESAMTWFRKDVAEDATQLLFWRIDSDPIYKEMRKIPEFIELYQPVLDRAKL